MFLRLRESFWVVLYPLAVLWAVVTTVRRKVRKRPLPGSFVKTISVGNVHSGGSGKTPMVVAIAEHFRGHQAVIVSRGYAGTLSNRGALLDKNVPPASGPTLYGDEPWMLAQRLGMPVYIGRDRRAVLERVEKDAAGSLAVFDDAFQHFSFHHGIDIIAIKANRSPLDTYCLPLGDLREPMGALAEASAVVLVEEQPEEAGPWRRFLTEHFPALAVFNAQTEVEGVWGVNGRRPLVGGEKWLAFCGIARPEGFKDLAHQTVDSVVCEFFPDHHPYSARDIDGLVDAKNRIKADWILTTEKDWYKVRPLFAERCLDLFYLRIRHVFAEEFWYFLETRLGLA